MIRKTAQQTRRYGWRSLILATAVLMVSSPASAQTVMGGMSKQKPVDFSDHSVHFKTPDGVVIEADYYPVKVDDDKKTPVAILIHMYPADRSSWKGFVPRLREAGIAVLAYDIRGRGGSVKPKARKLAEGYDNRDTSHFSQAWMDVEGAVGWLRHKDQRNIDADRVVVIGASIGCSISLDHAGRTLTPKAIVCLSPGTNYMGVNSLEHIRNCASIPILLISPEGEFAAVEKLAEAGGKKVKTRKYPGDSAHHGTKMFEADYGRKVEKKIMKFVRKHLGIKAEKKPEKNKSDKKRKRKGKKKKSSD